MASPEATDLQGHNEPCLRAFDFPPATANLLIQDSALLAKAIHFTTRGLFLRRDRHQKRTECLKPWFFCPLAGIGESEFEVSDCP